MKKFENIETSTGEYQNNGTQTDKTLITLTFIKNLKPPEITAGSLAAVDEDTQKRDSADTTGTIPDWLNYARDTEGLGNKGIRNVNVSVQCDIKVTVSGYRQL